MIFEGVIDSIEVREVAPASTTGSNGRFIVVTLRRLPVDSTDTVSDRLVRDVIESIRYSDALPFLPYMGPAWVPSDKQRLLSLTEPPMPVPKTPALAPRRRRRQDAWAAAVRRRS